MTSNEREKLFEDHKHLIHKMAAKFLRYRKVGVEYDDLYQEAGIGLHLAATHYNEKLGGKQGFERYAVTRMYQSMMPYFCKQNILSTPYYVVGIAAKIKRLGLIDTPPGEIAKILDESLTGVEGALKHLRGVITFSLDTPIEAGDNEKRTISDLVADAKTIDFDYIVTNHMFYETLTDREKTVFELMLRELTHREIGESLNLSRGYMSNITLGIKAKYKEYVKVVV